MTPEGAIPRQSARGVRIHRDPGANPFQPVSPGERPELWALVRGHDFGGGRNGGPVHEGDQAKEAPLQRQAGDVGTADLVGPIYPHAAQQIGIGLGVLLRPA